MKFPKQAYTKFKKLTVNRVNDGQSISTVVKELGLDKCSFGSWIAWFKHHLSLEPIGYITPVEAKAKYYRQLADQAAKTT